MAEKETVVGADSTATYEPVVQLQEVEVDTGEKDEECIYKQRCALFRFASECEPQAWKERGKGDIKFLKHKQTGAIRIVMRQEKTLKLVLNHIIHPLNELKPNSGSDRFWTWRSRDFSSDEPVTDTFGLRFKTAEIANEFKKEYDNSRDKNATRKIGTTEKTELKRKGGSESTRHSYHSHHHRRRLFTRRLLTLFFLNHYSSRCFDHDPGCHCCSEGRRQRSEKKEEKEETQKENNR